MEKETTIHGMMEKRIKKESEYSYMFDLTKDNHNEHFVTIPEWRLRAAIAYIEDRKKHEK